MTNIHDIEKESKTFSRDNMLSVQDKNVKTCGWTSPSLSWLRIISIVQQATFGKEDIYCNYSLSSLIYPPIHKFGIMTFLFSALVKYGIKIQTKASETEFQ